MDRETGGVQALRNNPSNTVLTSIPALQAAVRANPELQGRTVGGLIDYAKSEFDNDTITANDIQRDERQFQSAADRLRARVARRLWCAVPCQHRPDESKANLHALIGPSTPGVLRCQAMSIPCQ